MIPVMYSVMTKMFSFIQQQAGRVGGRMDGRADQQAFIQMFQSIFSDMETVMITAPILTGLFVVLVAAAVTRRLHDRGMHGYWGLMPLPFMAFGLAAMPKIFATWPYNPNFTLFILLFLNNLFSFAALILLIVLLAQRSSARANRFGPEVTDWRYSP
jgi:uncharacterized membrane protein YhaH (DUF805 family)